ncbi:MAG: hypothetical protein IJX50_00150 [Clostridia bacterium]|nr:hypothetical protein [Clostridia bacterium]
MTKFFTYMALMLWFANQTGLQRINPWWGTFATFVFMREMLKCTTVKGRKKR